MTKICSLCKVEKEVSEFNRKTGKEYQPYCRPCQSIKAKEHYKDNKEYYINKATKSAAKKIAFINSLKNRPCFDCGNSYPPYVMDFDHRDPSSKLYSVSFLRNGFAKQKILDEIAKCDLVCANCHRERTHGLKARDKGFEPL